MTMLVTPAVVHGRIAWVKTEYSVDAIGWHTFRSWLDETGAPVECSRS
jgi:hypothetical protein